MEAATRAASNCTDARPSRADAAELEEYYAQQLRILRRVMPLGMAKKHIEDLRAMHRGHDYHSDGHISATPEPASGSDAERNSLTPPPERSTPATSIDALQGTGEDTELIPGQARRRVAKNGATRDDARFVIEGDPLSSDDAPTPVSISSESESDADNADGRGARWWTNTASWPAISTVPRKPKRAKDDIDRLLSRTGVRKPQRSRLRTSSDRPKQRHARALGDVPRDTSSSRRERRGPSNRRSRGSRVSNASSHRYPSYRPNNPPIAHPRSIKSLDLVDDTVLFDVEWQAEQPEVDGRPAASLLLPDEGLPRQTSRTAGAGRSPRFSDDALGLASRDSPSRVHVDLTSDLATPARLLASSEPKSLPARKTQQRLDEFIPSRQCITPRAPMPDHLQSQQREADAWAELGFLTLDFGIRPLPIGICFDSSTSLGRGKLHDLLAPRDGARQPSPPRAGSAFFGVALQLHNSDSELIEYLPKLFDNMFDEFDKLQQEPSIARGSRLRMNIAEAADFFLSWSPTRLSSSSTSTGTSWTLQLLSELARLQHRLASIGVHHHAKEHMIESVLAIRWLALQLSWRSVVTNLEKTADDPTTEIGDETTLLNGMARVAGDLMVVLLCHGLHRTMKSVKDVMRSHTETSGLIILRDYSAELWVSLIHLLSEPLCTRHGLDFWLVLEKAVSQWDNLIRARSNVVSAESVWYITLSMCALSQFSSSHGSTGQRPKLDASWSMIKNALDRVRLRFDTEVERTMPSAAISKRDQYLKIVVQRCLNLSSLWHWRFVGAEAVMTHLFKLFDAHRLTNLPRETDHDFAPFLREYDARLLYDAARHESTAFHVFIKLLAAACKEISQSAADKAIGDRQVSRLMSRVLPIRVMPFTQSKPPTALERSMLFNHYSLAMLFLFTVPSAATQRLRQMKSFLAFGDADLASQVTCIRAMLYAAVIFRHHKQPLEPIMCWFSSSFASLLKKFGALEVETRHAPSAAVASLRDEQVHQSKVRQQRSITSLIVTALRSVQHMIDRTTLDPAQQMPTIYPDLALLDHAWTCDVLETQLAVDPSVGNEAMKIIQAFLLHRNRAVASLSDRQSSATPLTALDDDSQDSFADLFPDADLDDEMLRSIIDDSEVVSGRIPNPPIREQDRDFAHLVSRSLLTSIFRHISNIFHPDRLTTYSARAVLGLGDSRREVRDRGHLEEVIRTASRRSHVELAIDCWTGCAHVLVQNGLRDWSSFLSHGIGSFKHFNDDIAGRDIGLRFLHNVASLDRTAFEEHEGEFLIGWFASAPSPNLSIQHIYTRTLSDVQPQHPWLASAPWNRDERGVFHQISLEAFEQARTQALRNMFKVMAHEYGHSQQGSKRRSATFACLSALLTSLRIYAQEGEQTLVEKKTYCEFGLEVCQSMRSDLGPTILRGADLEIRRTVNLLQSLQQPNLPSASSAMS
ncbi:Methyl methanesulphonate-sensitivity protein 22 [Ceraceosorus bombacis]|uniref:Methyl methanesulphonate-sensitivity protein 22 n=1 Tax=Ceraceosorus bombacis TaxID=401625 RepID=A0A0P1BBS9_9BASI|nr:Methyl methanesulphonate-sensitivity protein 22 [Ceraceosorus bombacis]